MAFNPDIHHRKSIRITNFDYAQPGAYFITVCTHQRAPLFGHIAHGEMQLNKIGQIIQNYWHAIPNHFPAVCLDEFIVMPNHIHGIVVIENGRGTACRAQYKDAHCQGTACRAQYNDAQCQGTEYHAQYKDAQCQGTACRAPTAERFGKPIAGSMATIIRSYKSATTKSINEVGNTPGMPVWQRNYWERIIRDQREMESVRHYIRNNPTNWQNDDLLTTM